MSETGSATSSSRDLSCSSLDAAWVVCWPRFFCLHSTLIETSPDVSSDAKKTVYFDHMVRVTLYSSQLNVLYSLRYLSQVMPVGALYTKTTTCTIQQSMYYITFLNTILQSG